MQCPSPHGSDPFPTSVFQMIQRESKVHYGSNMLSEPVYTTTPKPSANTTIPRACFDVAEQEALSGNHVPHPRHDNHDVRHVHVAKNQAGEQA